VKRERPASGGSRIVTGVSAGDLVAGVIPGVGLGPRTGTFADHVASPATALTRVPDGVEAQQAAVMGLAGIAAHDALEALAVQAGETVLVSGATGGVGSIALQLALQAGATVIGTARPGKEEEYVRGLGATHTVDWTGDFTAAVRGIAPDGVDKALHFAGDAATIGQLVRAGGTVASTLGATPQALGRDDITLAGIMASATADKLAHLLDLVANGKIRVNIEATVPLDRAQEALGLFTDGTLGKVLVTR
jgi:NADPH:quinone reductase-like Zn-dependent oxidoreductase